MRVIAKSLPLSREKKCNKYRKLTISDSTDLFVKSNCVTKCYYNITNCHKYHGEGKYIQFWLVTLCLSYFSKFFLVTFVLAPNSRWVQTPVVVKLPLSPKVYIGAPTLGLLFCVSPNFH